MSASRAPTVVRARRAVEAELHFSLSAQQYVDTRPTRLTSPGVHVLTQLRETAVDEKPSRLTLVTSFCKLQITVYCYSFSINHFISSFLCYKIGHMYLPALPTYFESEIQVNYNYKLISAIYIGM